MTIPAARETGALVEAQGRGVGRATGAYLFALLLLVAIAWLVRPELALLESGTHLLLAAGGLAVAALLTWLFPVKR